MGWAAALVSIFLALAVWRHAYLDSPPYWDDATGLWADAAFLADTSFDYTALAQARAKAGSLPETTVVAPTLLAAIMIAAPSQAIVVGHLIVIAAAAAVALLLVALLRNPAGWPAAVMLALLFMVTPLVSAQVEQLGSQLPMCALCLLSLWLWGRGMWKSSVATAGFAILVNTMAIVLPIAVVVYLLFKLFGTSRQWASSAGWRAVGPQLIGYTSLTAAAMLLIAWLGANGNGAPDPTRYEIAMGGWLYVARFWTPEVVGVILLALLAGTVFLGRKSTVTESRRLAMVAWLALVAMVAWLSWQDVMPDDLPLAVALSGLVFGSVLMASRRLRPLAWVVAAGLLVFDGLNQYGRFYPAPTLLHGAEFARTGSALSRSLEYRHDHRANLEAVRSAVRQSHGDPVIAAAPLTYFLAQPRLGYVNKPVAGFGLQSVVAAGHRMRDIHGSLVSWPRSAIFVVSSNPYYFDSPRLVLTGPGDGDEIFYRDAEPSPLVVFRRQWPAGASQETVSAWLFERFSMYATVYYRAMSRAVIYERRGQAERAIAELEREARFSPDNTELHLALADLLHKQGQTDRAAVELASVLQREPNQVEANLQLGILRLEQNRVDEATPFLDRALKNDPDRAEAHFFVAAARARRGKLDEAIQHYERSLKIEPRNADGHYNLGLLFLKKRNRSQAAQHFRQALRIRPDFTAAKQKLSQLDHDNPPAKPARGPKPSRPTQY